MCGGGGVSITSKIISRLVPHCASAQSWPLYSAALLGDQVADTMTRYTTQSHHPDPELSGTTLAMLSAWPGSGKYVFSIFQAILPIRLEWWFTGNPLLISFQMAVASVMVYVAQISKHHVPWYIGYASNAPSDGSGRN